MTTAAIIKGSCAGYISLGTLPVMGGAIGGRIAQIIGCKTKQIRDGRVEFRSVFVASHWEGQTDPAERQGFEIIHELGFTTCLSDGLPAGPVAR